MLKKTQKFWSSQGFHSSVSWSVNKQIHVKWAELSVLEGTKQGQRIGRECLGIGGVGKGLEKRGEGEKTSALFVWGG